MISSSFFDLCMYRWQTHCCQMQTYVNSYLNYIKILLSSFGSMHSPKHHTAARNGKQVFLYQRCVADKQDTTQIFVNPAHTQFISVRRQR